MLTLSLFWFLLGSIVGLLANAARLRPASWQHLGWVRMAGVGAIMALAGGWLGVLLLGRYFASSMALWIAVAGSALLPWTMSKVAMKRWLCRK